MYKLSQDISILLLMPDLFLFEQCHELMNSERELAKFREDLREQDGRLKWTQSKLRVEMDAYKVTSCSRAV